MRAAEARQLAIGDWVQATVNGYIKACEVIGISWPRFKLRTLDCHGQEMILSRRYPSIGPKIQPQRPSVLTSPSWLIWPGGTLS